jgi:hypothetical protein
MATVTFIGDEAEVVWCGVRFERGKPTPTDHPHILEKAKNNQFFKVSSERKAKAEDAPEPEDGEDAVFAKGAKAKADGKPRNVPPAYRGKDAEVRWLAGYDEAEA